MNIIFQLQNYTLSENLRYTKNIQFLRVALLQSIYGVTTVAYLGISLLNSLFRLFHGRLLALWTRMNTNYYNANTSVRCQTNECEPSIQINHAYHL